MKVLVTGGCGYIGSATARWLRARGVEVQVIDDLSEGHQAAWDGPLEVLDLLDREERLRLLLLEFFPCVAKLLLCGGRLTMHLGQALLI